jgi:hypothetical protein
VLGGASLSQDPGTILAANTGEPGGH